MKIIVAEIGRKVYVLQGFNPESVYRPICECGNPANAQKLAALVRGQDNVQPTKEAAE